ncbi:MAG: hypothetical protein GYA24_01745 [Candidatus Lokiarchaeota archaeon]|nr:hypothetical protein [Candidatus Lokiarchaeota archaeon]
MLVQAFWDEVARFVTWPFFFVVSSPSPGDVMQHVPIPLPLSFPGTLACVHEGQPATTWSLPCHDSVHAVGSSTIGHAAMQRPAWVLEGRRVSMLGRINT